MAVYAVYLEEENQEQVHQRVAEHYPGTQSHKLADNLYLVRSDTIAQSIAEALGIRGDNRDATGVVFKLNDAYAGYASRAIWEWLLLTERA